MPLTAPFTGRRQGVAIATEATRGTAETTMDYWIPYASLSFKEKVDKVEDISGYNVLEASRSLDVVKKWAEGDMEFNVRDLGVGPLLLSLFGTEAVTANSPSTGCHTHTFTMNQTNQKKSLTVWKKNPFESMAAANCMVTSLKLSYVLNQYVRATVGLIGKTFASETESFAYTEENKFRPQDAIIKLATNVAGLGAASAKTTIRSLSLNFAQDVTDFQGLGSADPVDFINGNFSCEGEFEIAFEDATTKNYVLNNTLQAMSVKVMNTGITIGASSNPSLELVFDQLNFIDFDLDDSLENVAVLTAKFKANYNNTNSSMVKAILVNTLATAY
jgi:hypothetical protein